MWRKGGAQLRFRGPGLTRLLSYSESYARGRARQYTESQKNPTYRGRWGGRSNSSDLKQAGLPASHFLRSPRIVNIIQ